MNLRIHLYVICWNEAKILPHFLKYYHSFCEKIFVYDNFSSDCSPDIIAGFNNAETFNFFTNNEIRDDIYLKLKNEVWKKSRNKCDFVIVCDADEFIYHPDLNNLFEFLKLNNITAVRCEGYNMIALNAPREDEELLITYQEGVRSKNFDKVVLRRYFWKKK